MAQTLVDPFLAADLDTNRAGCLADDQRRWLRGEARAIRKEELVLAVLCGAIAAVLATATGPAPNAQYRPLAAAGFGAVAVLLAIRAMLGDSLSADLRSGSVKTIEGAIAKSHYSGSGSSPSLYYVNVNRMRFQVGMATYESLPDAGVLRVYYLPRSHKVVNLEHLADRPLPAGFDSAPMQALASVIAQFRSHDQVKSAEARAEFASLAAAIAPDPEVSPERPPADKLDPRPLAQAVVGSWRTGLLRMAFADDGSATLTMPGGHSMIGHWSVTPDGRLRWDWAGEEQLADAWVADGHLTISTDGRAETFERVG